MGTDKYISFIATDPIQYIKINNEFLKKVCDILSVEYTIEYENLINSICSNQIGVLNENEIFTRLINESISLDFLLYLVGKRYRDHYIHQFNVASLGDFLLSIKVSTSDTLLDAICYNNPQWNKDQLLKAWWATALLHDHAYPIDFLIKFAPKIPKLRKKYTTRVTIIDKMRDIFKDANRFIYSSQINSLINDLFDGSKASIVDDLIPILEKELDTLRLPKTMGDYLSGHHIFGAINLIYWLREANDYSALIN